MALAAAKAYAHADELVLGDAPLSVVKSDVRSAGLGPPRSSLLTAPARPRRRHGPWELNLLKQAAYTFEDAAAADRVTPRGATSDRVTKMREALATCSEHVGPSSPELAPLLCELACAIVQHAESCEAMAEAVTLGSRAAACLTASRSQDGLPLPQQQLPPHVSDDGPDPLLVLGGLSELCFLLEAHGEHQGAVGAFALGLGFGFGFGFGFGYGSLLQASTRALSGCVQQ